MDLLAIDGVLLQHVAVYVQPDVLRLNRTLKTNVLGLTEAVWERACRTLGAGARPAATTWREYYDSVMAPLARAVYAGDWSHTTGTRALVPRRLRAKRGALPGERAVEDVNPHTRARTRHRRPRLRTPRHTARSRPAPS